MYKIKPGNNFGVAIIGLIQEEFGGDYDYGISTLMTNTGLAEEEVLALIETDEELAIDEELLNAVATSFESTSNNAEAYNGLYVLALNANGEVDLEETFAQLEEEEDEYEDDEDDYDYEEDEEDEEVEASYASNSQMADFNELRDKVASIENLYAIKTQLAQLTDMAEAGVHEGWLPPIARDFIVGSFNRDDDQVAAFSQMCEASQRDADTILFSMGYALNVFKRGGSFVDFNQYVEGDTKDPTEAAFSAEIDEHAKRSLEAMGMFDD